MRPLIIASALVLLLIFLPVPAESLKASVSAEKVNLTLGGQGTIWMKVRNDEPHEVNVDITLSVPTGYESYFVETGSVSITKTLRSYENSSTIIIRIFSVSTSRRDMTITVDDDINPPLQKTVRLNSSPSPSFNGLLPVSFISVIVLSTLLYHFLRVRE